MRLPPEYAQALRELPDTTENAFYWRDRRRHARRSEPWRALLNAVFLLAVVFGLALAGLWALLYLQIVPDQRIPAWLGGKDGGGAIFALTAGAHALLILFTARSIVQGALPGEARRGTLYQLLTTRVPAFEMLAQMTVYPFQQAFLVALAGLPFYAMLMSFGSVSLHEVFVLYLLFLLLSVSVPHWRTPAFAEYSPEEIGQLLRAREQSAGCVGCLFVFLYLPGAMIFGSVLLGLHLSIGPQWFARLPPEVWPALPALPVTFAWVAVRVLTAPYTWFGLPLPVWAWLFPLILLSRIAALWQSSLYLRISHYAQLAALPDVGALHVWQTTLWRLTGLGVVGYCFQPLLESGQPAAMRWTGAALLALAAVLLLRAVLSATKPDGTPRRDTERRAMVYRAPQAAPTPPPRRVEAPPVITAPPLVAAPSAAAESPPLAAPPILYPPQAVVPSPMALPAQGVRVLPPPLQAPAWAGVPASASWRWRPLSPMEAAVLRWLVRKTDNPVALYSARRVLPGSLGGEWFVLEALALIFGLLAAYVAPPLFYVLAIPPVLAMVFFPVPNLADMAHGCAMLIGTMVMISFLSASRVCSMVANGYRMERERATLGFVLATPLSSLGVAVGHCIGAVLPQLALWGSLALGGLAPMACLAVLVGPGIAFWGWGFGFFCALLYLAISAVSGAWIGITEEKARDITVGVYLLPAAFYFLGAAAAFYVWYSRHWSYAAAIALFLSVTLGLLAYLWFTTLNELHKIRRGDLPFEGRSVSN